MLLSSVGQQHDETIHFSTCLRQHAKNEFPQIYQVVFLVLDKVMKDVYVDLNRSNVQLSSFFEMHASTIGLVCVCV